MISNARDEILDKQLYNQNLEMTDKKLLTIDNIRDKYLNPNNKNIFQKSIQIKKRLLKQNSKTFQVLIKMIF